MHYWETKDVRETESAEVENGNLKWSGEESHSEVVGCLGPDCAKHADKPVQ